MQCPNGKPPLLLLPQTRRTSKEQTTVSKSGIGVVSCMSLNDSFGNINIFRALALTVVICHFAYRPKHYVKVHVWAGISLRGPTSLCIFDGTMDADLYLDILRENLLPFIQTVYPDMHYFMQDNDPKHTSKKAQQFLGTIQSTGGRRLLNYQTATRSKISGMN